MPAIFCYQLIGLLLSAICSECPNEMDKPHILAYVIETSFLLFQKQIPSK
jgi:hypothetical protein